MRKPAHRPSKRLYHFLFQATVGALVFTGGSSFFREAHAQIPLKSEDTAIWTREQASQITPTDTNTIPPIAEFEVLPADIDVWIWDSWPLRNRDSSLAKVGDYYILFALVAPRDLLPEERHDVAEIGYFYSTDGQDWTYGGPAFPDNAALGSRQWAGSALLDEGQLYLFYTAVGRQVEPERTFEQRLALATATVKTDEFGVRFEDWTPHQVILEPEGRYYQTEHQSLYEPYGADQEQARADQLSADDPEPKAAAESENVDGADAENNPYLADLEPADIDIIYSFRDPWFFTDPADNQSYLLFVADTPGTPSETSCPSTSAESALAIPEDVAVRFNGSIGLAIAPNHNDLTAWQPLPPLMNAVCVNQQLERPHVLIQDDQYYLFFSTHEFTFVPDIQGIEGLFGFVSDTLQGEYAPLNGDGLVLTNPPSAPFQTFSWVVLPDAKILSFINYVDLQEIDTIAEQPEALQREKFGGTFAPIYELMIDGQQTRLNRVFGQGAIVD